MEIEEETLGVVSFQPTPTPTRIHPSIIVKSDLCRRTLRRRSSELGMLAFFSWTARVTIHKKKCPASYFRSSYTTYRTLTLGYGCGSASGTDELWQADAADGPGHRILPAWRRRRGRGPPGCPGGRPPRPGRRLPPLGHGRGVRHGARCRGRRSRGRARWHTPPVTKSTSPPSSGSPTRTLPTSCQRSGRHCSTYVRTDGLELNSPLMDIYGFAGRSGI